MPRKHITEYEFGKIYPMYVQKAESKGRTRDEVDEVLSWLTGYDAAGLEHKREDGADLAAFFDAAPQLHPNRSLIKGVVCGVRVEDIEDPKTQLIRYMDKLIDELAKGKVMEKILRV